MAASATAICDLPSDQFRRHSSRTMTGRCRDLTRTRQRGNIPILLKIQVERTAKTRLPRRRARVGGLCGFRSPAERVPVQQQKTGRCANVRENRKFDRSPAQRVQSKEEMRQTWNTPKWEEFGDFGRRGEKAGQNRGVVRAPQRSHLPAVRAVSGIYEGVPNTAKNSRRALRNEKSPPFQGKQRGSNEKHEVNTEKW